MKLLLSAAMGAFLLASPPAVFAAGAELAGPELVEIADVSVGLNGLVCDFCSIALNKTFGKRSEVTATYVDLDAKTLSLTLKDGETLSNEDIIKLVKKAGYNTVDITRKDGSVFTPPAKK